MFVLYYITVYLLFHDNKKKLSKYKIDIKITFVIFVYTIKNLIFIKEFKRSLLSETSYWLEFDPNQFFS